MTYYTKKVLRKFSRCRRYDKERVKYQYAYTLNVGKLTVDPALELCKESDKDRRKKQEVMETPN